MIDWKSIAVIVGLFLILDYLRARAVAPDGNGDGLDKNLDRIDLRAYPDKWITARAAAIAARDDDSL